MLRLIILAGAASEPVPDTPRNRARYGGPMSRGGSMTAPAGD